MAKKKTVKKTTRRKVAKKRSATRGRTASRPMKNMTIEQIQEELKQRKKELANLEAKRDKLMAQLKDVNDKIAIINAAIKGAPIKRGRGRPKGSKNKPKTPEQLKAMKGKRPRNAVSLEVALANVLKGKQMGVNESAAAVKKAGYKSSSPNFRTIVNQTLIRSDLIKKVSRGQYTAA